MTDFDKIKQECNRWEGLYGFSPQTKNVINSHYPFMLLQNFGSLFNASNSKELKSNEALFIKKAIKRINDDKDEEFLKRFLLPVKIAFNEKDLKLKLFHGLIYDRNLSTSTELTWLVIGNKVCDILNNVFGLIPENLIYFGIEIPKDILNDTIRSIGISVTIDNPNYEIKPNPTTIFIKSLDSLMKYYYEK